MTSPFTTEAAAFNPTLLLLFLALWLFAYYITVLSPTHGAPNGFESSALLSNLHSVPLCILAALSLLDIVDEVYPLCWSLSFFVVDVLDCAVRRDLMWGVHGMISLVLNVATGGNGVHRGLRSLSKGFFTEASTVRVLFVTWSRSDDVIKWCMTSDDEFPLALTSLLPTSSYAILFFGTNKTATQQNTTN